MTRLLRAELRKVFTTRLWWGMLLGALAFTALEVVALIATAGLQRSQSPPLTTAVAQRTLLASPRAEGKKGARKADGLQAVLDRIAEMAPEDRALAERVHVTVTATAPRLSPRTWYGMPAYANADGKVVVFFQNAGKFS